MTAEADPMVHRCTIGTLSYKQVKDGTIWCRVCSAIYDRTEYGWQRDPRPLSKEKPKFNPKWKKK